MLITCPQCNTSLSVEVGDLTGLVEVECTHCGEAFPITVDKHIENNAKPDPGLAVNEPAPRQAEISGWHKDIAALCINDQAQAAQAQSVLESAGYKIIVCREVDEIAYLMENETVELLAFSPDFQQEKGGVGAIFRAINTQGMKLRRRLMLLMIAPQVKTMDQTQAFFSNVNGVINSGDIAKLTDILTQLKTLHNEFYRAFLEEAE